MLLRVIADFVAIHGTWLGVIPEYIDWITNSSFMLHAWLRGRITKDFFDIVYIAENHERRRRALSSARLRAPATREWARLLIGQQRDARAAPQAQREVPHIASGIRDRGNRSRAGRKCHEGACAQSLLLLLRSGWHAARPH